MVSPFDEMMSVLRQCLPEVKVVGTLFAPAEVNSVFYKDLMLQAAKQAGIEVELIGVSTTGEVADAALSLCSRNIDAVCQISDNMSSSTFVATAAAAKSVQTPCLHVQHESSGTRGCCGGGARLLRRGTGKRPACRSSHEG